MARRPHAARKQFYCRPPGHHREKINTDKYYVYIARVVGAARDKNHDSFAAGVVKRLPTTDLEVQFSIFHKFLLRKGYNQTTQNLPYYNLYLEMPVFRTCF